MIARVKKEINLGRIAGPFPTLPISNLQVSPIGIVPKSDGVSWRLITHLSYPENNGINDFIDEAYCTVRYTSFDKVVEMISSLGRHAKLAVVDIKSAFRLLRVNPGDFDLLGFKINDNYYIDKCMPFGLSISCKTWENFATFLHWLVEKRSRLSTLDHYLDDYIFAGTEHSNDCQILKDCFLDICKEFGVPIATEKMKGPVTVLTFLGLIIDTDELLIRVPADKRDSLLSDLKFYTTQKKITLKNLQSLVGSLNFFCKAVRGGRAFNRRFYDLTVKASMPHHKIRLNEEVKDDMRVWIDFLQSYNGKTYFPEAEWCTSDVLNLYSDSSGSKGAGAFFAGAWFFFPCPITWLNTDIQRDITLLEFIPVVLAMAVWGTRLQNKKIKLFIDNKSLVEIINSQTSRSKRVMKLMRVFVLYMLKNNIIFRASHIEGKLNSISDSISRQDWTRFRRLAPNAQKTPEKIPEHFQQLIWSLKPID